MRMRVRGQGAIEYLLIIGAAILVVAIVIVAMSGVIGSGKTDANASGTQVTNEYNELKDLIGPTGPGSPAGPSTPASCEAIKLASPSSADGTYSIDPDGSGALPAFDAYCDMTTESGGWTKVAGLSASTIDLISGLNYQQMVKCADGAGSAYFISPTTTLNWSWTTKQKVGGTWIVNGANHACGTDGEFDTVSCGWGIGCSNGGGGTNKFYPGTINHNGCADQTTGHTNGAFVICGQTNYGSYSVFVR